MDEPVEIPLPRDRWEEDWQPPDEFPIVVATHYCGSREPRFPTPTCDERCSLRVTASLPSFTEEVEALAAKHEIDFRLAHFAVATSKEISTTPKARDLGSIKDQRKIAQQEVASLSRFLRWFEGIPAGEDRRAERKGAARDTNPHHLRRILRERPDIMRLFDAARQLEEKLLDLVELKMTSTPNWIHPDSMDTIAVRFLAAGVDDVTFAEVVRDLYGTDDGAQAAWAAAKAMQEPHVSYREQLEQLDGWQIYDDPPEGSDGPL